MLANRIQSQRNLFIIGCRNNTHDKIHGIVDQYSSWLASFVADDFAAWGGDCVFSNTG